MMGVVRAKAHAAGRAKDKVRDGARVLAVGRARVVAALVAVRIKVVVAGVATNHAVGASAPGAVRAEAKDVGMIFVAAVVVHKSRASVRRRTRPTIIRALPW